MVSLNIYLIEWICVKVTGRGCHYSLCLEYSSSSPCHLLDPLLTPWSNLKYLIIRKSFPIPHDQMTVRLRVFCTFPSCDDCIWWCLLFEVHISLPEGTWYFLPEWFPAMPWDGHWHPLLWGQGLLLFAAVATMWGTVNTQIFLKWINFTAKKLQKLGNM